ncbi:hypothetical protein QFZ28_004369 [Neobacillus niacini]|uniref:phage head-tail connector protein n=1 Tax=Neobacillus niacini TaxID=86668 RepID=UPI0027866322|nr:phage head-tail connector protein [Neobacillus niacini]MDQ1003969.1 hypothetical protein [Neobacillus niacini]
MNLQEVKDILGRTDSKHDVYIDTVIPLYIDYVKEYCNNQSLSTGELPGGVKLAIAKMIEFNLNKSGVSSSSFGEVSYSYSLDFPPSILRMLQPYSRIRV